MGAWSQEKIWKHDKGFPNILLAIPIRCRDLNRQEITKDTQLIDVIKTLFPDLKGLTSEDFHTIRKQTLLLLDGIDEFKDIESIKNTDVQPHIRLIKNDVLDPSNGVKPFPHTALLLDVPKFVERFTSYCLQNSQ